MDIGWIIALVLLVLIYIFINHTKKGYEITVVGVFSYISEGELVELEGDYTEHPMYGQQ